MNSDTISQQQKAKCLSDVFDMINTDLGEAKAMALAASIMVDYPKEFESFNDNDTLGRILYRAMFYSSRMLLITQGLKAQDDKEVFNLFHQYFITPNLIDSKYASIVAAASHKDFEMLQIAQTRIAEFAKVIIALYENMDKDTLKFNIETALEKENLTELEVNDTQIVKEDDNKDAIVSKDFRGVSCPMNFVKTKLALEAIQSGEKLEVLLDDGEPIANVPNSTKLEGHSILSEDQRDDGHWSVLIEKA